MTRQHTVYIIKDTFTNEYIIGTGYSYHPLRRAKSITNSNVKLDLKPVKNMFKRICRRACQLSYDHNYRYLGNSYYKIGSYIPIRIQASRFQILEIDVEIEDGDSSKFKIIEERVISAKYRNYKFVFSKPNKTVPKKPLEFIANASAMEGRWSGTEYPAVEAMAFNDGKERYILHLGGTVRVNYSHGYLKPIYSPVVPKADTLFFSVIEYKEDNTLKLKACYAYDVDSLEPVTSDGNIKTEV